MIKTSRVASFIKKIFGFDDGRDSLSVEEIIALDYYECISYLYKGKEKPKVTGFRDGVNIWLETSVGSIEFDEIPHSKGHLTNNVQEIEILIGENGLDDSYVINLINKGLDQYWK